MNRQEALAGLRVLVVEDEFMIAVLIEETLADQLCTVVGPFNNVADALAAARRGDFDAALLDVNVRGEEIYPVAEYLAERSVPFLLLSGYGADAIPAAHPDWQACGKPFTASGLTSKLAAQILTIGRAPGVPRALPSEISS